MRGAVRLSALMGLPVVWVWTHDSVGLGEDGPTHQPIEHYAALRAIPHLWVIRPGDAERDDRRRGAWRSNARTGRSRCCSRARTSPVLDRSEVAPAEGLERGGYVLWDSAAPAGANGAGTVPEIDPDRDRGRGRRRRSRPGVRSPSRGESCASCRCRAWSCSKRRRRSTATRCCRRAVSARLAVEPGASMSWWKWVGLDGDVLGLDRFGASAPGATVLEELGFTAENIAARASALLESKH